MSNLTNQYDLPLRTHCPILASISTDNFTVVIDITPPPPPNIPSLISLDMITSEGSADELDMDYFYMIRNNNQVKDKYKARIDKGESFQINLKEALKGGTLASGDLYRCGISILDKDIWEYNK